MLHLLSGWCVCTITDSVNGPTDPLRLTAATAMEYSAAGITPVKLYRLLFKAVPETDMVLL